MLFAGRAKEEFDIKPIQSPMDAFVRRCADIYAGHPEWEDVDAHIKTINFAKSVCAETARLATLAIGIHIDGSARADWLQEQIDKIYFQLCHWVEYGCAYGTIILKPNGNGIDLVTPDNFLITNVDNGKITGAVFVDKQYNEQKKKFYARMEYHRFLDNGNYAISNRCYESDSTNQSAASIMSADKRVGIDKTPWAGMSEDVEIVGVDKPLYGVLRTPAANNIDISSPLGMPLFASALEELRDLDVAYSRFAKEIYDSARTVLLDSDMLLPDGGKVSNSLHGFETRAREMHLPDYVKMVYGNGTDEVYHEINPTLNTDERVTGINTILNQIGYKSGFENGHFVFDAHTGIQTATGVEAEQQRLIQTIKDVRDQLESCLDDLIYALDKFADLYGYAPVGVYEVVYDFGDITYNRDEDRARWYSYVVAGKIPMWYYLQKFEGMTEEEAKALGAEAQPQTPTLFGSEE